MMLLPALFAASALLPARANMMVYPIETEVSPQGTAQIRVLSKSDDVQFINVTAKQIMSPGTPEEKEIPVDMSTSGALVVAPTKLALSAGSERIVRLVSMRPPQKESTWRLYFEGVKQPTSDTIADKNSEQHRQAQVGVSIIWGALIHVAPETIKASLAFNPTSGKVVNNGTIRLPLREIGACDSAGTCQWQKETATVYPGTELTLKSLKLTPEKNYRVKYYHWIDRTVKEIEIPAL